MEKSGENIDIIIHLVSFYIGLSPEVVSVYLVLGPARQFMLTVWLMVGALGHPVSA